MISLERQRISPLPMLNHRASASDLAGRALDTVFDFESYS
jgi:hypothetical protein